MSQPSATVENRAGPAVLFVALGFPTVLTWAYFVALADAPAPARLAVYTGGKLFQFALPLVWWVAVARYRLPARIPGQWPARSSSQAAWGLAVGAGMFALIVGAYYALFRPAGWLAGADIAVQRKLAGFGVQGVASFSALAAFYALVHAGLEEYYWRWFVFGQLRRRLPLVWAVAASSLAFTAHHVILLGVYVGMGVLGMLGSLAVAAAGAIWAWMYQRSGSLVGPWVSHILADAGIFVVAWDLAAPMLGG